MIPLWIVFTLCGSATQVARNAMQRSLVASLGTVGATYVRFLFALPFSMIFLGVALSVTGAAVPVPHPSFWLWMPLGAATQFAGTLFMLLAMEQRSFVVATAILKTEPVQVAIFSLLFLGDSFTGLSLAAIFVATAGVVIMAVEPGRIDFSGTRAMMWGLASAAVFALSNVGYRGALLTVSSDFFVVGASYTLVVTLLLQTVVLGLWFLWRDRAVLVAIGKLWRPSLSAGFLGALTSQFWFMAFTLMTPALVRTLALFEVLLAQGVSYYTFRQRVSGREVFGIVLIVVGVTVLLAAH